MKKKIVILGSTGSIGKSLLNIIDKDKSSFDIVLLSAKKDYKTLIKQSKKFNVKNLIVEDIESFKLLKKKLSNSKTKVFNSFNDLKNILKSKVDYTMNSITGINGLIPTLKIINLTKTIAIANKESIICGWNLIQKKLYRYKTQFLPVDSEHFSLWFGLKKIDNKSIDQIILTASGGPLFKTPLNKFRKITINQALNHPNWKMGNKISIDSATLINKIYEVIEARNIFNISYKKIKIIIHPKSYVHALIKFNNGFIKIIAHDTTMKIPIFNTLYHNKIKKFPTKNIDYKILNNLNFTEINKQRFPMVKILNLLPTRNSLFETVIVSANDTLVELFLKKAIRFTDIQKKLFEFILKKEFLKYKKITPKKAQDIIDLNNYVRLKIYKNVYKS